jgi:glycosyltransferase involved in cell wall biosynthesis
MKSSPQGAECEVAFPVEARGSISSSVRTLTARPGSTAHTPHVLYVIDQMCQLGGAERVLLEMIRRLPRENFRCSLVAFKVDDQLEALKNLPCTLHVLSMRRTYGLQAGRMALQLRRLIRNENVSIVHTFFESSDLWAAPVAKFSGCPILISSRRDMGILRTRKHRLAYRLVNRLFDRVLSVSEEVRSCCLREDGLPPTKVVTIYNGIDLAELDFNTMESDPRQQLGIAPEVPMIATVSNIRFLKGIDVLVRAAACVCREFPEAKFLIVGKVLEPETFARLKHQIASADLSNNIFFIGPLQNPYPVLRASNIFCLPSRTEGFSNALLEAMGCRLPCVATRVGGNAEAVRDGTSGFLVESEDHREMAKALLKLLHNLTLASEMGKAGRQIVEARFRTQAMMSQLIHLYNQLLEVKHA